MEHTGLLRSTLYLVRPDGYLGFVDPHADPERLRAYYFDKEVTQVGPFSQAARTAQESHPTP
jgi:hypothetical protein